jgi:mRNA interferase RelE/StbE
LKTFELEFADDAWKEWQKLGATVRRQFAAKLEQRLSDPHVPSARLSGLAACYKIKLRAAAYRLVYQVEDDRLVVLVVAVGKRERNAVYKAASQRLR